MMYIHISITMLCYSIATPLTSACSSEYRDNDTSVAISRPESD